MFRSIASWIYWRLVIVYVAFILYRLKIMTGFIVLATILLLFGFL